MYLRQEGYYCTNSNKEDYNFKIIEDTWDQSCNYCQGAEKEDIHWRNRSPNQAFFSVFNFQITHEAQIWEQANNDLFISVDDVSVPPYFPNHKKVRKDMAINYSNLIRMDQQLGERIKELKDEGLYDDAYIFFYSDHGGPFPRHKRAIYDTGVKVPFMIKFPKSKGAGSRVDALLSFIDLAPTVLDIAGIEIPKYLDNPIKTGLSYMDYILGDAGFYPTQCTILTGDPGCGKTTMTLEMASAMRGLGANVAFASCEMRREMVAKFQKRLGAEHPIKVITDKIVMIRKIKSIIDIAS